MALARLVLADITGISRSPQLKPARPPVPRGGIAIAAVLVAGRGTSIGTADATRAGSGAAGTVIVGRSFAGDAASVALILDEMPVLKLAGV